MSLNLRTLGVRGLNLPAKKTLAVIPSDFNIGGMLINAERRFNKAYKVSSMEEFATIFGNQILSTQYGYDTVRSFFDNVNGVAGSLYVQTLLGYTGGAIDAVNAFRNVANAGSDADALVVKAAYQDELEYGVSGNRTGVKATAIDRFSTTAALTAAAADYSAYLNSVIDIKVGDIVKFVLTGGGGATVYHTITAVDQNLKKITWTDAVLHATATLAVTDVVSVPGFKLQTYRQAPNGVITEVDTDLGKIICSTESAVTEYFVDNVFKTSNWIKCTYSSAQTLANRFIPSDANPVYCTSGADGTAVITASNLAVFLAKFDNLPIRFLAYPESTDLTLQAALITYSNARNDNPIAILNIADTRTKAQLITIGNGLQSSGYIPAVIVANWLNVSDPFATVANAQDRKIPNVGGVMGAWVWTIANLGIHFIPCTGTTTIKGANSVVGDTLLNNDDRTQVAEAGVNVIQNIAGQGIKIANLFTLSTDPAYLFGNGILMRNYIKVSAQDSLASSENTPNSFNRITADKMALVTFLYGLWFKGSTNQVPTGETFGQGFNADGTPTKPDQHFQVIADITNNPQAQVNIGERNVFVYFTYPAPAGSIVIGVGIILR
jgi:hypothetical protein